jgi:hypothetical protein
MRPVKFRNTTCKAKLVNTKVREVQITISKGLTLRLCSESVEELYKMVDRFKDFEIIIDEPPYLFSRATEGVSHRMLMHGALMSKTYCYGLFGYSTTPDECVLYDETPLGTEPSLYIGVLAPSHYLQLLK